MVVRSRRDLWKFGKAQGESFVGISDGSDITSLSATELKKDDVMSDLSSAIELQYKSHIDSCSIKSKLSTPALATRPFPG
jgi:hypothetical protein